MSALARKTIMEQHYYDRWKRSEELYEILLTAVEKIGKMPFNAEATDIAAEALEAVDAACERHHREDAAADRAYAAEEAADAKRDAMWEESAR